MFKYNQVILKVHNAHRAVSLSRFQNILQKGTDTANLVLSWGEQRWEELECLSEATKIPVKELKTEMTFQSLVPVLSLMPCVALERKQSI